MINITEDFLKEKDALVAEVEIEKLLREKMNKDFNVRVKADESISIIGSDEQYISISGEVDEPIIELYGHDDYDLRRAAAIVLFFAKEKLTALRVKEIFNFGGYYGK